MVARYLLQKGRPDGRPFSFLSMKKLPFLILSVISLLSCAQSKDPYRDEGNFISRTIVYNPGDYNSQYYRIPALITAKDGSLVIATDKRKTSNADLPKDIDIVINRSEDNGKTWSEPYTLVQGTGEGHGFGDAALVQTNEKEGLICAFSGGPGLWQSTSSAPLRSYICKSNDNGKSWSEPVDITHFIYGNDCNDSTRKTWRASFIASGNGLLTSSGRIILVTAARETDDYSLNNYALYSDNNGETWHVSKRASIRGDEAKAVELINGDILMSIRAENARKWNISKDNGVSWEEEASTWKELTGPACNGDLIRKDSLLIHSLPHAKDRSNVSVFISFDEGKTWPVHKTICPYGSAYSSLAVLPDGTVGIYIEEDHGTGAYSMVFYNFSLEKFIKL